MRHHAAIALTLLAMLASGAARAQAVATQEPTAAQRCLTVLPGAPGDQPVYPFEPFKRGKAGKVLVELRFTSADLRPALEILSHEGGSTFVEAVRDHVQHLRVPCLEAREGPSTVRFDYVFRPEADRPVQSEQRERMPPDSTGMGCPFNVSFTARQPELPNHVVQRDNWRAERQPFMAWLRALKLEGPTRLLDAVYGDTTHFQVPCYKIESTPSTNKE
ncbi:hypothetical protein [Aquabacterium sp. OR-4]|uniref:hypothetical protein n=1 Tax=Aquabacterium sp. OR-4 TaxID=2978127 RepID=UPI0021B19A42|nr:hypothetical protein [Aquabacterium sp. OR-4]MDT7834074.1 hypothetical protein [Aquabacterium sp. OR-4]